MMFPNFAKRPLSRSTLPGLMASMIRTKNCATSLISSFVILILGDMTVAPPAVKVIRTGVVEKSCPPVKECQESHDSVHNSSVLLVLLVAIIGLLGSKTGTAGSGKVRSNSSL